MASGKEIVVAPESSALRWRILALPDLGMTTLSEEAGRGRQAVPSKTRCYAIEDEMLRHRRRDVGEEEASCEPRLLRRARLLFVGGRDPPYTPIFATSRVFGWMAHYNEQVAENKRIRPDATYMGPTDLKYVPIDRR